MSCQNQRIRVLERKVKAKERVTTMTHKGRLYFAEKLRRPIRRGGFMILTDIKEIICGYDEDDCYWLYRYTKIDRTEDNMQRMLQIFDDQQAEQDLRLEAIASEFEDEIKRADRGVLTFDMSDGKAKE